MEAVTLPLALKAVTGVKYSVLALEPDTRWENTRVVWGGFVGQNQPAVQIWHALWAGREANEPGAHAVQVVLELLAQNPGLQGSCNPELGQNEPDSHAKQVDMPAASATDPAGHVTHAVRFPCPERPLNVPIGHALANVKPVELQ